MTRATIKDVAKLANVSLKTVSRVINKESSVREATVAKVQSAIKELGYEPNLAARNLRSSKSYALGLVYDNPNPYYVIDVQQGVLSVCRDTGYGLQIHPCHAEDDDIEDELLKLVRNSDLSGLILAPPMSERSDIVKSLRDNGIQFVGIISGNEGDPALSPCICVDDRSASYDITKHLIDQGHEKIAFFWGEDVHKSSPERFKGYCDALKSHGFDLNKDWIFDGEYSFESGFKNAEALMNKTDQPTAIFCSNDEIAAGALVALTSAGKSVPEDYAITGFEDSPFSRHSSPPLTTAKQATETIAAAAARHLINDIRPQENAKDKSASETTFSPSLIIRQSTTG